MFPNPEGARMRGFEFWAFSFSGLGGGSQMEGIPLLAMRIFGSMRNADLRLS